MQSKLTVDASSSHVLVGTHHSLAFGTLALPARHVKNMVLYFAADLARCYLQCLDLAAAIYYPVR